MSDKVQPPNLTPEELNEATWGDLEGYKLVQEKARSKLRWQTIYEYVILRESDNTFWLVTRALGNTENQDHDDAELVRQVFQKTKTVVVYE